MKPKFFKTAEHFRKWLEKNHDKAKELLVGFHKKGSGKPSITWPESVDQALCFGWIDGVRKRIDENSYTIRFSRRRHRSIWSRINIRKATELEKLGVMHAAGLQAFKKRDRTRVYSYENSPKELAPEDEKKFRANKAAWAYWEKQPPSYRRVAIFYVVSAKKEETRRSRLARLIDSCEKGKRL